MSPPKAPNDERPGVDSEPSNALPGNQNVAPEAFDGHEEEKSGTHARPSLDCSDIGNGRLFAQMHSQRVRWHAGRRVWLAWDGHCWVDDPGSTAPQLAVETADALKVIAYQLPVPAVMNAPEGEEPSATLRAAQAAQTSASQRRKAAQLWALESRSHGKQQSMIAQAQHDPRLLVRVADLNPDPWLLNCRNGVVDLRTLRLTPPSPDLLQTCVAGCEYVPSARSEVWEKYLRETTGGDAELASYLQRVAGYLLHGERPEKAFWFGFGPGDGGKSVFLSAIDGVLGTYSASADASTWATRGGGNRGDLVRLADKRLVVTSEVADDMRFDMTLLKKVTGGGGDKLTFAAKFEKEIEFAPRFGVFMIGNSRPYASATDGASWNRIRCVPFTHVVPKALQDRHLSAKLASPAHAPAVLHWMVEGLTAYLREGLGSCRAVEMASAEYRRSANLLDDFVSDAGIVFTGSPNDCVLKRAVAERYDRFCRSRGVRKPLLVKRFAAEFAALGARYDENAPKRVLPIFVPEWGGTGGKVASVKGRYWGGITMPVRDDAEE